MSSKKERRRLYEGFGVLDSAPELVSNKVDLVSQQLASNKPAINQENESLASHSPFDKPVVSQQLASNKPANLSEIIGDERQFLFFIFKHLEFQASRETLPITTHELKITFSKKSKAISNLIDRLVGKNVLKIKKSARGNASWRIFFIPEKTFNEIRDHHSISQSLASHSPFDKPVHRPGNAPNSSSKDNNYINTTIFQIPEEIKHLISGREVSSLLEKDLLSAEDIQRSLDHFSYDFKNNLVKAKTSPINLLFGLMRSGRPYKSLTLLEEENRELHQYQVQLQKLENENKRLKEVQLKEKFIQFKKENPDFLESIRKEQKFELSNEVLEEISFSKFLEKTNNERIRE